MGSMTIRLRGRHIASDIYSLGIASCSRKNVHSAQSDKVEYVISLALLSALQDAR